MERHLNNNGSAASCAVLVASCDRYADLWPPFYKAFASHWSDCPFPIYHLSESRDPEKPGVQFLPMGPGLTWSEGLLSALARIPEPSVILFLEDLLLVGRVDTGAVRKIVAAAQNLKASSVRMSASPPPDRALRDAQLGAWLGISSPGTLYRVSTVTSYWDKAALQALLRPEENAWQFELQGTKRADDMNGFYATKKNLFPVFNSVIKGKWRPRAARTLEKLGFPLARFDRPRMSWRESAVFYAHRMRTRGLSMFPAPWRRSIRETFLG
jgi:hypothetical protein